MQLIFDKEQHRNIFLKKAKSRKISVERTSNTEITGPSLGIE